MNKPYRFIDKPDAVKLLNDAFAPLNYRVSDCIDPDNAYEPATIILKSSDRRTESLTIQCDRNWWPDGTNYEDAMISLRQNDSVLCEIDINQLLQSRLTLPLSRYIVDELVAACRKAT